MTITANLHRDSLDYNEVSKLKELGLSNARIAERLGVTQGAIYYVLNKSKIAESKSRRVINGVGYIVDHRIIKIFLTKYKPKFCPETIT
jgi:orotate phosphoribosyltransferase-like protein